MDLFHSRILPRQQVSELGECVPINCFSQTDCQLIGVSLFPQLQRKFVCENCEAQTRWENKWGRRRVVQLKHSIVLSVPFSQQRTRLTWKVITPRNTVRHSTKWRTTPKNVAKISPVSNQHVNKKYQYKDLTKQLKQEATLQPSKLDDLNKESFKLKYNRVSNLLLALRLIGRDSIWLIIQYKFAVDKCGKNRLCLQKI